MIAGVIAASAVVGGYLGRKQIAAAWVPTSNDALEAAEAKMYEPLGFPVTHYMVPCGNYHIHTIHVPHRPHGNDTTRSNVSDTKSEAGPIASATSSSTSTPIPPIGRISPLTGRPPMVLIHGLGGGAGLWSMNLDALSREYEIIAIDLLGFGRSSRVPFTGRTADDGIAYWIDSLHQWRIQLGIDSMILVGHSLGGYVVTSYALQYPQYVSRLVLVCPFGIVHSTSISGAPPRHLPWYMKVGIKVMTTTSPQTFVRLMGPSGPSMMFRFRGAYDNGRYVKLYGAGDRRVSDYVYHLTAGSSGSGDYAFMSLVNNLRYVIRPLSDQLSKLAMPVTCIYGARDPIVIDTSELMKAEVKNVETFTIEQSAHQCYASHSDQFHTAILHHLSHTSTLHATDAPPSSSIVPPPTLPPNDPLGAALEI